MSAEGLLIRDLVHPALTVPLRNHQNSTFKLIKLSMKHNFPRHCFIFCHLSVSDFNYQLSKIHEQHATDMAHLVETFRKKTNEVQSAGPTTVNTIAIAWEQWMADVMQASDDIFLSFKQSEILFCRIRRVIRKYRQHLEETWRNLCWRKHFI